MEAKRKLYLNLVRSYWQLKYRAMMWPQMTSGGSNGPKPNFYPRNLSRLHSGIVLNWFHATFAEKQPFDFSSVDFVRFRSITKRSHSLSPLYLDTPAHRAHLEPTVWRSTQPGHQWWRLRPPLACAESHISPQVKRQQSRFGFTIKNNSPGHSYGNFGAISPLKTNEISLASKWNKKYDGKHQTYKSVYAYENTFWIE